MGNLKPAQWAWEFLRRNPDYIEAYDRNCHALSEYVKYPDVAKYDDLAVEWGIGNGYHDPEEDNPDIKCPPKADKNQVPNIKMLQENNIRKGFLEYGEYLALVDALPEYLKGFVAFGYKTGWRKEEICSRKWQHVDLEVGIVRLEPGETKNSKGRTGYLDEELKAILQEQWEKRKSAKKILPYVFLNGRGTDRIKQFDKAWKTY